MKAKAFLVLPLLDQVKTLDAWADLVDPATGEALVPEGDENLASFDEFATDFLDKVVMPFPEGSTLEVASDMILNVGGGTAQARAAIRKVVLTHIGRVTNFAPFAGWAEGLPD